VSETEDLPDIQVARDHDCADNDIRYFMRDRDGPSRCSHKADFLEAFCSSGREVHPTEDEGGDDTKKRCVALINDWSIDGSRAVARDNPGGLTAPGLRRYLEVNPVGSLTEPARFASPC
jgi:hypothetical protein